MKRETGRSGLASYFKREAAKCGRPVYKIKFEGSVGCPDYLVLSLKHGACFVELKATAKKPRETQKTIIKKLNGYGVKAVVLDSRLKVDMFLLDC